MHVMPNWSMFSLVEVVCLLEAAHFTMWTGVLFDHAAPIVLVVQLCIVAVSRCVRMAPSFVLCCLLLFGTQGGCAFTLLHLGRLSLD